MPIRAEDPNIIYEVAWFSRASTALTERGPSTRRRPFEEGPVVCPAFDDCVNHARHLGGNGGQRLALEVGTGPIPCDVALELVPEAVLLLTDGDLGGHPESASKASIAELRQLGLSPEDARLMRR